MCNGHDHDFVGTVKIDDCVWEPMQQSSSNLMRTRVVLQHRRTQWALPNPFKRNMHLNEKLIGQPRLSIVIPDRSGNGIAIRYGQDSKIHGVT